jgi:predicted nucleic acid-binding protein
MPSLFGRVIVPGQVAAEFEAGVRLGYDLPDLRTLPWADVRAIVPIAPEVERAKRLGPGESAVLTLALSISGALAIIDDLPARKAAARLGIRVTGTLNLLVAGKRRGHLQPFGRCSMDFNPWGSVWLRFFETTS